MPQDGLGVLIGTFQEPSNPLDLASLSLDSECYFEDSGGYTLQIEEEDLGDGRVRVFMRMEETRCAVLTAATIPLQTASLMLGQL